MLGFGNAGEVSGAVGCLAHVWCLGREVADVSDPGAGAAASVHHAPRGVINAAAWTAVDDAEENEAEALVINAKAPVSMAAACAKLGVPFVHISTDYVFDGTGQFARGPDAITSPLQAYGRTKRAGEIGILRTGANAVVLRTSWVFDGEGKNFVTTMRKLAESRDTLTIVGDQVGGPTPARAIAQACIDILEGLIAGKPRGIQHFSGAPDVSWADFARAIFDVSGQVVHVTDIPTTDYPTPATRPLNSRLDCSELLTQFGVSRPDWKQELEYLFKEPET